jgi:hypothetical protein
MMTGMVRLRVILAVVTVMAAAGVVIGLSSAGAETDQPAVINEEIVVGGVTVYRTERDNGPALYEIHPLSDAEVSDLDKAPAFGADSYDYLTTGDVDACELLAGRPGQLVKGCAVALAMQQRGDLDAKPGLAQLVYSVCGRDPGPGEIEDCGGQVITEDQVAAAQQRMRDALAPG